MSKIEKSTLFTEITLEQSATVRGGDNNTVDPGVALAQKLVDLASNPNITLTFTNTNTTNNNGGTSSSQPPSVLPGLSQVSGGSLSI